MRNNLSGEDFLWCLFLICLNANIRSMSGFCAAFALMLYGMFRPKPSVLFVYLRTLVIVLSIYWGAQG